MENLELEEQLHAQKTCQSTYVIFAAIIAAIGGILFGYDIGITSGALLQLKDEFHLTSFEQEMVVSAVLAGAFCASFFGGNIVDSWGRKVGIGLSCLLFTIGALTLSFSINFLMLIVGRFIVGVAVSLSVTSECTYISEISPPNHRGMMVSLNEVGITIGFLLAYLINFIFINTHQGWKYMFGMAAVLALIQAFGVAFMPNSHHYLIIKGETDKARKVLCNLRKNNNVEEEMESIISSIEEQKTRRYLDLFSTSNNMRARMLLGMTLVFLQQFSGNANVLYYAPTVFQHFGYDTNTAATLVTVGLGVVKVFSTIVTLVIVDKVGRKSLLMCGCLLMATSIMVLGIVGTVSKIDNKRESGSTFIIHHELISTESNTTSNDKDVAWEIHRLPHNFTSVIDNLEYVTEQVVFITSARNDLVSSRHYIEEDINKTSSSGNLPESISIHDTQSTETIGHLELTGNMSFTNADERLINTTSMVPDEELTYQVSLSVKITSVIALMVFVCAYGMSYGPVTWLILSEIFPGCLRGRAFSVATCINWGANIVVSLTFLDVLNAIGIGPTFITYGFISYGAAVFIFLCVPETKSKTLEEINELMSKGFLRRNLKTCTFAVYHEKYTIEKKKSDVNITSDKIRERKNCNHDANNSNISFN